MDKWLIKRPREKISDSRKEHKLQQIQAKRLPDPTRADIDGRGLGELTLFNDTSPLAILSLESHRNPTKRAPIFTPRTACRPCDPDEHFRVFER